jgi:membrane-anchored protein YejM (alkaline phosphatase superfamily)
MADYPRRAVLFRWVGWFALVNALVLTLLGLRYLANFSSGGTLLSWVYVVLVFPSHFLMLAFLPLLVLVPVILSWPSRRWVTALAVMCFAALIAVTELDSLLWSQSRFHINGLTMQILGLKSWIFGGIMFVLGLFFEFLLATWTWRWVEGSPQRHGLVIGLVCLGAVISSQLIHAWADASYYVPVTSVGVQLPVYKGLTAARQLARLGLVDPEASRERLLLRKVASQSAESADRVLNYPLSPLKCSNEQPMNLLLIMADAMRSDMLQEATTPFLWKMAGDEAQWFTQHFSGGNSSRMGVFSLFYGLPPGYWSSFESLQRSSVFVDELQRQNYSLGIFSSATLNRPVSLDRTAFADIPNLRMRTAPADAPAWQRDQVLTGEWKAWLRQRDRQQPFFGFLLYDASNMGVYPEELNQVAGLEPVGDDEVSRRRSDYAKSIRFLDGLIKDVLDDLEQQGVADRTIVIITSDHGQEFDDTGAGLMEHGSGYTTYQLKVPFLVRWPGRPARRFDHRTSHYDVLPTLMTELLGCNNPVTDYASGVNVFEQKDWEWLLAGSYYNYAILEPDQVTITYPGGNFEVRRWDYGIIPDPEVRGPVLEAVSVENSRFYRQ